MRNLENQKNRRPNEDQKIDRGKIRKNKNRVDEKDQISIKIENLVNRKIWKIEKQQAKHSRTWNKLENLENCCEKTTPS